MSKELLKIISNLSKYHREHEKYYGQAPLTTAISIQNASKTLKTLADKWISIQQTDKTEGNPYLGCEDLNEKASIQHDGLLFMEGENEPSEIIHLKRNLNNIADDSEKAGIWLSKAMENSWESAVQLIKIPTIEDVLGERHRIIANDWQAAQLSSLMAKLIQRSLLILNQIEFKPGAIRSDLSASKRYPQLLYSSSELLDRAADLAGEFALLVHDNERRWRVFRESVEKLRATLKKQDEKTSSLP
ncbi:MAG: hypothetical protein MUC80_00360 [Candidatus Thermoplasmatota archaeon]|jgi:hypothetical protein|nr:hypothetical protein [Candidatus Thermoplasmatota archaeon]